MNILIVDDIEDSRLLLKKILEFAGHSVIAAINGIDALEKARHSSPDLIVSDIFMPEMDGFGFCREIKKDSLLRTIPFIFYTSTYTDPKDERLAEDLGVSRFIVKPIDSKAFLDIIRDVMNEHRKDMAFEKTSSPKEDVDLRKAHEDRLVYKLNEKNKALEKERSQLLKKEAELRASEEKYHSIFNNVNDAIFILSIADAGILDVNRKMCDMFGYSFEEALQLTVQDLSAGDPVHTMKTAQAFIEKTINEGPQVFEWQCIDKAGRIFWVDVNLNLIKLEGEDRIIAVVRDLSEQKQAEEALQESEHKLKVIFDNTIDGILVADVETKKFVTGNKAIIKMLGYSLEEIRKLGIDNIHPRHELPSVLEQFRKQANKEIVTAKDIPVKRKDGSVFYADINASPVNLIGRNCLIGMFRDISRDKKAQEQLLLVQASIDNTSESIFWIDKDARFINVNNSACTHLGYTKEEMLSMHVSDVDPNFPVEKWFEHWKDLKKRGAISYETIHKHKNGTMYPVEVKLNYMKFGGKEYNFAFARDITERKRSENAFRESEARFRAIFESSPVGITIADSEGKIIDSNPAFQNMLGYTKEELSRKFSEITYPEDVSKNMHLFQEMLDGKRDHYLMEKRYYHKDGSIVWANLIVTVIRDRNREFKYNFAIIENITERKKLEDQLRHAQKMEAVGQLAGGVAHDFNNILTAIIGYGSLLKLKLKGDEQLIHNINQILAITERGASLTQSLLAFSRKQNISLKPIKLNSLIERISKLIPRLIGEEIEFRKNLCHQDMTVMADSSQLEQVLMNLAGNARDAMPDSGVLTIETEKVTLDLDYVKMHGFGSPGPYALISVSDTGIGIDPETMDKIFEPFFTTKEVGEGTGLGLSLVYGIIKQHNGYVGVYSEPDRGTTFKIHLPLIKETKTEKEPVEDDSMVGGTETILLAEDEAEVRGAIKEILQEYGFSVIEAVDGKDAIVKFSDNKDKINLLLMDVVMPKMNGKEAYDEIKKTAPGIKAIFTSGYTIKTVHAKGVFQDGVHFISKPVIPGKLLKKIREVMDES